jgi:hypothetical protein
VNARFLVFIATVSAVLGLSAFYIGVRLVSWSTWAETHADAVWMSLGLIVALQFLAPLLYRVFPGARHRLFIVHWLSYTALGVFACVFFYVVAVDLAFGLVALAFHTDRFSGLESLAVAALVAATVVIGTLQVALGPKVYEIDIPLAGLPAVFDGFRIVQITDLHLGPLIGRRYTERCVRIANALDADLVALTGDFVDGPVAELRDAAAPLATLRARHGSVFITGNHEYYWGALEWVEEFRRLGARVLLNEHITIERDGAPLVIAGVTDYASASILPAHVSDPRAAMRGAPAAAIKVLLAHQPKSHERAAVAGFDVQLSGHTHGGQFFPFTLVVRAAVRYYKGLARHGRMWIYTSRGTGYWGPPLRFGVPAEIALIRLRRAAREAHA